MPPLLLQPLVENSIRHGLEPKVEGGEIIVARAARRRDALVIEVRDTGVGIGNARGRPPNDGGFGLAQVRERLATRLRRRSSSIDPERRAPSGGTLRHHHLSLADA